MQAKLLPNTFITSDTPTLKEINAKILSKQARKKKMDLVTYIMLLLTLYTSEDFSIISGLFFPKLIYDFSKVLLKKHKPEESP